MNEFLFFDESNLNISFFFDFRLKSVQEEYWIQHRLHPVILLLK